MNEFISICNRILYPDDVNVRGWREVHNFLTGLIHEFTKHSEEFDVMVTGSTVEGGKMFEPDDVGDIDVIVSSKLPEDMVKVDALEDIPQHLGFVKIKQTSSDDLYIKTSTLNKNIPEKVVNVLNIFQHFWPKDKESMLKLHYKLQSPAHELEVKTRFQPLESQLQDMGEITDTQKTLFQNMVRLHLHKDNFEGTEDIVERLTSMTTGIRIESVDEFFRFCFKLGTAFQEEKQKQELCDDNTARELGPGNSTIATNRAGIVNAETDLLNASTGENKYDEAIMRIFWNSCKKNVDNESLLPSVNTTEVEDTKTDESIAIKMCDEDSEVDLVRKAGMDFVMAKRIIGWPNIAQDWLNRQRLWPPANVVEMIKNEGKIYVVVKHPESITVKHEMDYIFRLSFSHPELNLCQQMNKTQISCYRLMKSLHKAVFKACSKKFTSYHIKTILFWAIEKNDDAIWVEEKLEECIALLLMSLFVAISDRFLEHYFIKGMDLFQDFQESDFMALEQRTGLLLEDMTTAFKLVEEQFNLRSKEVLEKTAASTKKKSENMPIPSSYNTFYQRWSEKYDMMTTEFTEEVAISSDSKKYPNNLKEPFKKAIERNELTRDGMLSMFNTVKSGMYQKHSFNLKDLERPLEDVVLDDIKSIAELCKFIIQATPDGINNSDEATDTTMNMLLTGAENGSATETSVVEGFMPDTNEVLKTFTKFFLE